MNKKHRKTLIAVFTRPTPASIAFSEIESLLVALGGTVGEREGSRIRSTCWVSNGAVIARTLARKRSDIKSKKCAIFWSA